ncbi:endophilin-B2a isoform X6 [Salvelinus fontinalis]|uniref:Endophilin-B2 n=1 Tax=Salmo salar TaxID=8030 RepID=A0A1S3NKJ7_SALSA|nr:endophilin-B2a isoform X4 [Salmo salar]XP_029618377.1 endophilin-B2-like isoform X4 [Salmo trutta]XP_055742494.1 endophilin-B2a isoform X6 [Salvelinus fontinalis]|eukprot:XP_014015933.1 PREDICTED: endophilin-B2-like isoform X4 [Salmo salar]
MDFNVKKLASDAGVFFTRAVQFTGEKFGQVEKTELDAHFENLLSRADSTKNWTEKIFRQTEVLLQPNPSARIEEFLYEKLDRTVPSRPNNGELLGHYMQDAAKDFGPGTPYGSTLIKVGDCERRLGGAQREFLQTSAISFLAPLRNFLEGDWRTISKERRLLENRRLDLDSSKARLKKAKLAESKAAAVPDFQETRPRNYVLSASASALWSEEVDKAAHELRVAQTEFDRQAEVTRLLLEGISSTHVNHLRCLHEFVEAQTAYYKQCYLHMQDLQKELGRFPNAFAGNPGLSMASGGSSPQGNATLPQDAASAVETDTLKIEEVQAPATGTRKAKVLYDYDAADTSELSLLADELITVYTVPGMDSDWLVGERGNQKGRVPVTYLELLS